MLSQVAQEEPSRRRGARPRGPVKPQRIAEKGDEVRIQMGCGRVATVSRGSAERIGLHQYRWCVSKRGFVHANISRTMGRKGSYQLMLGRLILGLKPGDPHRVWHHDGDYLNLLDDNLGMWGEGRRAVIAGAIAYLPLENHDAPARVLATDYERLKLWRWRWYLTADASGYLSVVSAGGTRGTSNLRLHRLIAGFPDGVMVDHVDCDTLNNLPSNLRAANASQNATNRHGYGSCPYLGVSHHKRTGKWAAEVAYNGSRVWLGLYESPEAAALVRDQHARMLHGAYGRYNFPDPGEQCAVRLDQLGPFAESYLSFRKRPLIAQPSAQPARDRQACPAAAAA